MTLVRVKPIGNGTPNDPIRVSFPTYSLVQDMGPAGWVVDIPDAIVPPSAPPPIALNLPGIGMRQVIMALPAPALAAMQALLDRDYPARDKSVIPTIQ